MSSESAAAFIDLLRGSSTVTEAQAAALGTLGVDDIASAIVGRGWCEERAAAQAVATFTRETAVVLAECTLDLRAVGAVPEHFAFGEELLPLLYDDRAGKLTLATTRLTVAPDVGRWRDALDRDIVVVRAVGCVLRKLLPHAYAVRAFGETRLRGRSSTTNTPQLATLTPKNAAATVELAGVMNTLTSSFDALRAVARVEGTLPRPPPVAPVEAAAAPPPPVALKSASTILPKTPFRPTGAGVLTPDPAPRARAGARPDGHPGGQPGEQGVPKGAAPASERPDGRAPTGRFPRVPDAPAVPPAGGRAPTGSFATPRDPPRAPTGTFGAARPPTGSVPAARDMPRTPTGSFAAPRDLQRTPTGVFSTAAFRGADLPQTTSSPTLRALSPRPAIPIGSDPAPAGVRAAAAVVLILDVDAARRERRAAAVRGDGANVLTCGDIEGLRGILEVVKPAIAVVPSVVAGSLVDPVAAVRSAVDGGDIAVIVAGDVGVDAERYRTLIDAHDVVACLDPPAPEDAVRVAIATLLGRQPPPAARKGPRDVQLQTLRGSLRFSQSSGERLAALERVDDILAAEPTLADAWVTRGHLLVDLGRAAEAVRSFEVAATLDPTSGDAWIAWATQLDRAGLARRAVRTWQHAAAIVTDDAARRRIEARLRR
jgi:hypothetical protein